MRLTSELPPISRSFIQMIAQIHQSKILMIQIQNKLVDVYKNISFQMKSKYQVLLMATVLVLTVSQVVPNGDTHVESASPPSVPLSAPSSDQLCAYFSEGSTICTFCLNGYYINGDGITGKCVIGNKSCNGFTTDGTGKCGDCFSFYTLKDGDCVLTTTVNPLADPQCAKFVKGSTICQFCRQGYYINGDGVTGKCVNGSKSCAYFTEDGTGKCGNCFASQTLTDGSCVPKQTERPLSDPQCLQVETGTTNCIVCTHGYFVNIDGDGKCVVADPLCLTYAMLGGSCTSCKYPYHLSGNTPNTCCPQA